jgi:shikimate 5-dehydrogenase
MEVFPCWASHLGLSVAIEGIDCKPHDDPERYRAVVRFIRDEPNAVGALITAHKVDLFKAAHDLFDQLDHYARLLGEVSCLAKRGGRLHGYAKDPVPAGLAMGCFVPENHWAQTGGEFCVLGAGGSSLALTARLMETTPRGLLPAKIVVTDRNGPRLEEMQRIHARIDPGIPVEYHHTPQPADADEVVGRLSSGSLVVNATGVGKDTPGSPLSDAAEFPRNGYAWDFNYRGDLHFLEQARSQQLAKHLHVEDGWNYFLYGWITAMAEVFNTDIPTSGPGFDEISRIAASARKS